MPLPSRRRFLHTAASASVWGVCAPARAKSVPDLRPTFRLSFPESLRGEPFTGRVYVFFSSDDSEPRLGENWFNPPPMLAKDVVEMAPGEIVELSHDDPQTLRFPRDFVPYGPGKHLIQGVMRFNPWERTVGTGSGNAYSTVYGLSDFGTPQTVEMRGIVGAEPVPESRWCRAFRVPSTHLTEFLGRPVNVQAMVLLPASYFHDAKRRYPVLFSIHGFGGTLQAGYRENPVDEVNAGDVEFLRVYLDPSCPLGHHTFADSANNGPWGTALVEEFIPALDAEYRTVAEPRGRFLTGHSSGGWSSLWLQVTYPEHFGGVWSTAPDPVDFRDFQRINIYEPGENMFVDPAGERRPIARAGGRPVLWYDDFCHMEDVLGPGGQLHSFEAVFSPRSIAGTPLRLWDRETGAIDPAVVESWKAYDIRLVLEQNWSRLEPLLRGKLHIHMGEQDTFYLEGATRLLGESLRGLGSDAVVELHPGRDHSNLMNAALIGRMRSEMVERFLRS
jgi:pimeloyl-ACP methyl ester carboxylesterase